MKLRQARVFKRNGVDQTSAIIVFGIQSHSQSNFGNDARIVITIWKTSHASGLDVSKAEINYAMMLVPN